MVCKMGRKLADRSWWSMFSIFINDLEGGIDSTVTMFGDSTKLGGEVERTEGKSILERNLDRLEEWASRNIDTQKGKVLHLTQIVELANSSLQRSRLAANDLGVLVSNKLKVGQQYAAAAMKVNTLGCIYRALLAEIEMQSSHSAQSLSGCTWSTVSSYGPHN